MMNNRKIISVLLSIFILIGVFSLVLNKFNLNANAQTNYDNYQSSYDVERQMCCSTSSEGARVYLESDKVRFSESENILVTYYVNSKEDITDISYTQTGFDEIAIEPKVNDSKRIQVELSCIPEAEEHYILIKECRLW